MPFKNAADKRAYDKQYYRENQQRKRTYARNRARAKRRERQRSEGKLVEADTPLGLRVFVTGS